MLYEAVIHPHDSPYGPSLPYHAWAVHAPSHAHVLQLLHGMTVLILNCISWRAYAVPFHTTGLAHEANAILHACIHDLSRPHRRCEPE